MTQETQEPVTQGPGTQEPDAAGGTAGDAAGDTARPLARELTPEARRALAEAAARRAELDARAAELASRKETDGRGGLEPVRYGDWEIKGLASDF